MGLQSLNLALCITIQVAPKEQGFVFYNAINSTCFTTRNDVYKSFGYCICMDKV